MATTRHFVTANRLDDGSVVYLSGTRTWVASFAEAKDFADATASALDVAWAKTREAEVCGSYAFEVEVREDGSLKLSSRERLRREGGAAARTRLGY